MGTKTIQDSTLTAIANAIRSKTGDSGVITPLQMPSVIESISTSGGGVQSVNILDGVSLNTGYLDASGNPAAQDSTKKEVYTDEIDISNHLGESIAIYVATKTNVQHWIGYCLYDENHAFVSPRTNVQLGNCNCCGFTLTLPSSGVKYIRFSFRTYTGAVYAAGFGLTVFDALGTNGFCKYPIN